MQKSKAILRKAGVVPFLKLAERNSEGKVSSTGPHRVKLISDRIVVGSDYTTGKERHEVEYLVEEKGQKLRYRVPVKDKNGEVHYLVQRLAEYEEGEEVVLEYRRHGLKGFISVNRPNESPSIEEVTEEDIPGEAEVNELSPDDKEQDIPEDNDLAEEDEKAVEW